MSEQLEKRGVIDEKTPVAPENKERVKIATETKGSVDLDAIEDHISKRLADTIQLGTKKNC